MFRQGEDKFRAYTFGAYNIYVFTMVFNDFFGNGKSKSCTFFIFTAWKVSFVKAFPYFSKTFFWNAYTVVFYWYKYFLIFFSCMYLDSWIVIAEFYCIVYEILYNLLDFALIGIYKWSLGIKGYIKRNVLLGAALFKGCETAF